MHSSASGVPTVYAWALLYCEVKHLLRSWGPSEKFKVQCSVVIECRFGYSMVMVWLLKWGTWFPAFSPISEEPLCVWWNVIPHPTTTLDEPKLELKWSIMQGNHGALGFVVTGIEWANEGWSFIRGNFCIITVRSVFAGGMFALGAAESQRPEHFLLLGGDLTSTCHEAYDRSGIVLWILRNVRCLYGYSYVLDVIDPVHSWCNCLCV